MIMSESNPLKDFLGFIFALILISLPMEAWIRFESAPKIYRHCMEKNNVIAEAKEEYCTCEKDLVIKNRYRLFYAIIKNDLFDKELPKNEELDGYSQCVAIKDNAVEKKIKNNFAIDVRRKVREWLPSEKRDTLKDIVVDNYRIKLNDDWPMGEKYVVETEFTVSSGMFGVIQEQHYEGKFYYNSQGELVDREWKGAGNSIDARGAIEGVKEIYDFFNNN